MKTPGHRIAPGRDTIFLNEVLLEEAIGCEKRIAMVE